jgi:rod shape-determining protein MreD
MARSCGYLLCLYFAFAWQATLRPVWDWHGCGPNFLVLALVGSCVLLSDVSALIAAAVIGLLSDSLTQRGLGPDVLVYVCVCVAMQALCPPRLVRNPLVLLVILCGATICVEFTSVLFRSTLNHQLVWSSGQFGPQMAQWGLIACGDGIVTALLAVLPLVLIRSLTIRGLDESQDRFANRWHRLT